MAPLKLIFAGSGAFGVPTLKRLIETREHEIVQVVTQPDRPAGRGLKMTATPVGRLAVEHHLPLLTTPNLNAQTLPDADVMVVIAFGQKIAPHVVEHPKLGSINLHGSILPKFRGAAPVNWAIINGETITGNSVIRLAEKMDAGAIIAQSQIPIGELETAGELHDRLAEDGVELIVRTLAQLRDGTGIETPQDHSKATIAPKLARGAARINWSETAAAAIGCQIRGMYPWPGCRVTLLDGDRVKGRATLVRARLAGEVTGGDCAPGAITPLGTVAAADRAVEIVEIQPEGKRPMPLQAYRNGHDWRPGMRLESIT